MKSCIQKLLGALGYKVTRNVTYLDALKNLIGPAKNPIIFDVGAHYGESEKEFSRNFINSSIYCFEPFKPSFLVLKNNVSNKTYIFNIGFSDIAGKFDFHSNLADPTNSLLSLEDNAHKIWGLKKLSEKQSVTCEFTTIDEFVFSEMINHIDLLKIDVQGAEYKVLSGAKKMLSKNAIKIIFMEIILAPIYVGQWGIELYIKEMASYGYELYGLYNMSYDCRGRLLQVDAIFTLPMNM